MKRRTAAPFHRLSNAVSADPWMITVGEGAPAPLEEVTPDWDYAAPLVLARTIRLRTAEASRELGLDDDALRLEVVVEAGTGPGNMPREIVSRTRIPLDGETPCAIVLRLDPSRLSAQITLRTSVILAAGLEAADALSPRRVASRLWDDLEASRIEGDDPRFPMEVISFSASFAGRPHEAAPWTLSWSPGHPGRDFQGAARLYLNSDDEDFIERVQDQDPLTLQAMMGDVVSQMCETALRAGWDEDFDSAEEGSMAGRVSYWLGRAFPDTAVARGLLENRPGEFRSAILASMSF